MFLGLHTWVRVNRSALKQKSGSPVGQGPIHTVTVTGYPANISHTAKHVSIMVVEDVLRMRGGTNEMTVLKKNLKILV